MGQETKIEWTDATFNPWVGCTKVSPGCTNCYAAVNMFTRVQRSKGLELWGAKAERHVFDDRNWRQPFKWNAAAGAVGVRKRVFCASLADVFDDHPIAEEQRPRLWATIEKTPWLDWLLLTKRPQNALRMVPWTGTWPSSVWIGTTVEDQQRADERLPWLTQIPARVRFVSCEPLLEQVQIAPWLRLGVAEIPAPVNWVIVGGESGPKARPFNLSWARTIVNDCKAAGVPVLVKQLGRVPVSDDMRADYWGRRVFMWNSRDTLASRLAMRLDDPKGGEPMEWPADLRVREFPR